MRKKQLLATLIMLSLMQGNVYAEKIAYDEVHQVGTISYNNTQAGLWYIDGDMDYTSITITNSSNKFNSNSWVSGLYLEGGHTVDVVKDENEIGSGTVNIHNFTVLTNYTGAAVAITGWGLASIGETMTASKLNTESINISNVNGDGYEANSDSKKGDIAGIVLGAGGQIKAENKIQIENINAVTNLDAYGIQGESHYRYDRPAILNSGSVEINTVTGNENAYGISFVGTESEITNGLTISNITALNGDAYGLKAEKDSENANNMITDLSVGDIAQITNINATNGAAIGAEFDESNLAFSKNLSVSEVYGKKSATGILVNGGSFSVEGLNISKIDSPNYVNGLVLNDVASEKVTSAYINVNKDNVEGYAGHFLDEMIDDNNDDKADITRVALRANDGATVDWQAGGYEIYGAIVAGKGDENAAGAGNITISGDNNKIYGDVFAGNGGTINLNLGAGSVFHELGTILAGNTFHNSAFDLDVTTAGSVDLTLANGATWIARGQSYLSDLTNNGLVDMSQNENSSVTVSNLSGDGTIKMLLNAENKGSSDMLYVTDSVSGTQTIEVDWANADEEKAIGEGERLRFATTNGTASLNARTTDAGFFNVQYKTATDEYSATEEIEENEMYNGEDNGQGSYKPGNDFANETFDGTGTNHYILGIDDSKSEISDAGQTIINMSRANYSNAIYMDRLNKRMGEARYINPEDEQGMWVRLRHDRIGKEGAFRSQNTMYEMGYDVKQDCDNGDRRVGFAIDYMDGKTEYRNVAGDGDIKRYGLWLYDTWMGDKGHYADYVLKWGHLENDFDIYNSRGKVNGDYSNNVFSVSAEYGKKNDMGNDWYFEPQAQLQLARVTGADYVTSQNTKVSLDGINSLIGRAGFRLGKDMGERSTVYVKADVLHEFLGDQTISALDTTTNGTYRETFENKGTWYDVGFGFATALGKDSYAFMDFEKSFGNDNDETYQINAGVQWTF